MYMTNLHGEMSGWTDDVVDFFKKAYNVSEPLVDAQLQKVMERVRAEAGVGAQQAVAPYIYASLGVSALAIVLSLGAIRIAKRRP